MGRIFAALTAVLTLVSLLAVPNAGAEPEVPPVVAAAVTPFDGPAPSWIVADLDSGQILAQRDAYVPHPPASTIKTLLALVAIDELNLDSTVVATENSRVECTCAGVKPGSTYSARQLLDAQLLISGNDAAMALADMVGGPDAAVAKMTAKASSLGATNTRAASPSGLDDKGIVGWTTPHDLAMIFRGALANPVFAGVTSKHTAPFPGPTGDRVLVNDNELLRRYPGALGGKTGFTDAAKKTYVAAASRDGRRLVVAMMYGLVKEGGPTYWDQAVGLLDWGFAQDRSTSVGTL